MNTYVDDHDDTWDERREQRLRALGTRSPQCAAPGCEETDPFGLTGVAPHIVCPEHLADAQGRSRVESHHVAGRHNDPCTIPTLANDHGALSALQASWPRETLRNPNGSPLVRMAAWLRGWLDILLVIIDRSVGRIPAGLENLDALLTEHAGPDWWETVGWQW
jgi:hypothetical protein